MPHNGAKQTKKCERLDIDGIINKQNKHTLLHQWELLHPPTINKYLLSTTFNACAPTTEMFLTNHLNAIHK